MAKIAIQARMRNAILWRGVQEKGSIKALAEELDVGYPNLVSWVGLKDYPKNGKRYDELNDKFLRVLGASYEEVFELELSKEVKREVSIEGEVPPEMLIGGVQQFLPSPEELVINEEDARGMENLLSGILSKLSERQREILIMREGEGLSTSEVAKRLGISPTSVSSHYQTALKKARREAFFNTPHKATEKLKAFKLDGPIV
jgi:RNA polymerase sigma factor (sigma-70 family)